MLADRGEIDKLSSKFFIHARDYPVLIGPEIDYNVKESPAWIHATRRGRLARLIALRGK